MGRKPIGDRPLTNAEHQARHRRKLALKKRKELCARLGIDLRVLESGMFPRAPADADVEPDGDEVLALEPGDSLTSLQAPSSEDWERLRYQHVPFAVVGKEP